MSYAEIRTLAPYRNVDDFGAGFFGAPRGSRTHKGIDFHVVPGAIVLAPIDGIITKLGWAYAGASYRYVEIEDENNYKHRIFYVQPWVDVGEIVAQFDRIGEAQNVSERYDTESKKMKPHVHYEIKAPWGEFIDPDRFV